MFLDESVNYQQEVNSPGSIFYQGNPYYTDDSDLKDEMSLFSYNTASSEKQNVYQQAFAAFEFDEAC